MRERIRDTIRLLLIAGLAAIGARLGIPPGILFPPVNPPTIPESPTPPTPPVPPAPSPDPIAAIGRITFGNAGCTATVTHPKRADGRYNVLTAAHCVRSVGQRGSMRLRDGTIFAVIVQGIDKEADCCWLVTELPLSNLPYALVADTLPPSGTRIFHSGFGFDKPGNREDGTFIKEMRNGQVQMSLSVSSGDSGGGICLDADGRILSCVCCTEGIARKTNVYGASPDRINRLLRSVSAFDVGDWEPLPIPVVPPQPQ